jgi:hypothetical protein
MTGLSLKRFDDGDLIDLFGSTTDQLGNAINLWESGVKETNRLFAIRDEIRARGSPTQRKLLPLLDSKNRFVRYNAAQQLLTLAPERSRQVIEETAQQRDAVAGDAGMFLFLLDKSHSNFLTIVSSSSDNR